MRWNRREAGLVPPAQFIHVAEERGSIHELGRWIARSASAASVTRGWAALTSDAYAACSGRPRDGSHTAARC